MQALSVECPATTEGQTSQMSHPSVRIREFLKKQHRRAPSTNDSRDDADTTESGNSGDDQHRAQDNQSPPPNCSICLGRVKSKCFTDSCMHQFCFSCLLEWSKVKPECPLCKQAFKSIIHNVTSLDSYDEYKVEEQQRHVNWINITNSFQPLDFILSAGLPTYRLAINRVERPDLPQSRFFQLFLNETPLTERFVRTYPNDVIPPRYSGVTWRSYCYARHLYAIPINGSTFGPHGPHVRIITAQFFRDSPAQMHRLMPWLNRELICLCASSPHPITFLLQSIEHLIKTYDMVSREFLRHVRVFIPNHTDHFVHELINFARSPFDMIGYDRNVTYNPVFEDDRVITLSSSSSDESDIEFIHDMRVTNADATASTSGPSQENVPASVPATALNNLTTVANDELLEMIRRDLGMQHSSAGNAVTPLMTHSVDDSETDSDEEEITNYLHTMPTVSKEEIIRGRADAVSPTPANDTNNQISNRSSDQTVIVSPNNATETLAAVATNTRGIPSAASNAMDLGTAAATHNNVSDSDSDDCQFVCAKKPPHLRTPEFVELNSESDSDVVFVGDYWPAKGIKLEKHSKSKASAIIMSSAGPSTESSTNIIVTNSRRKRRHQNDDNATTMTPAAATNNNQNEQKSENITSACATTIVDIAAATVTKIAIETKPSTSSQCTRLPIADASEPSSVDLYQSVNRPNAIVFNKNSNAKAISYARKSLAGSKRMYESSSSSGKSTDGNLSSSSSLSSNDSDEIDSSSHEEYAVSASKRKRKVNTEESPQQTRTTRKKYRKKANVKHIVSRKKKKSTAKKANRVRNNRNKRIKLPRAITPSSDTTSDEQ